MPDFLYSLDVCTWPWTPQALHPQLCINKFRHFCPATMSPQTPLLILQDFEICLVSAHLTGTYVLFRFVESSQKVHRICVPVFVVNTWALLAGDWACPPHHPTQSQIQQVYFLSLLSFGDKKPIVNSTPLSPRFPPLWMRVKGWTTAACSFAQRLAGLWRRAGVQWTGQKATVACRSWWARVRPPQFTFNWQSPLMAVAIMQWPFPIPNQGTITP